MNPSEVSERMDVSATELALQELDVVGEASQAPIALRPSSLDPSFSSLSSLNASSLNVSWLRLAYALEFFIALIAIISLWSEIGGEGHLDLMPWYIKLGCISGLAWCCVRFTAGMVEQQQVWTRRTIGWFTAIVLFCIAMGAITYYYHLHENPDDGDEDSTATAVNINNLGTFFYHASTRTWPSFPICFLARSAVLAGDRVPIGSDGGDSGLHV
jgi:hypothetical protein